MDLNFDRDIYHAQIRYENAQETTVLLSVGLTRDLFDNETISTSRIVGGNVSGLLFNATSFSVSNSVSLSSGRYEFSLVLIIAGEFIFASVVLDILSTSKLSVLIRGVK